MGQFGRPVGVLLHPGLLRGQPQAVEMVGAQRFRVGCHHGGGEPPGHRVPRVEDDLGLAAPLQRRDPDLLSAHGLVPVHELLELASVRVGGETGIHRGRAHVELHPVPDPDAGLPGIVEDPPQQRDARLLPVGQLHRNSQLVGGQRDDTAAIGDVAAFQDVETFLDQVVNPGPELVPRPPAHAAVGVLHVREVHPPFEAGPAVVLQVADRDRLSMGNLLAFFEETATEMFFEQAVHGIERGVGPATGEHQRVTGAMDDIPIVTQGGFREVDVEFGGCPADVYPAGIVLAIRMRPDVPACGNPLVILLDRQFITAHAAQNALKLPGSPMFRRSCRRGQHDPRPWLSFFEKCNHGECGLSCGWIPCYHPTS